MTYPGFFTAQFFAEHAGVPLVPWASDFMESYNALRDASVPRNTSVASVPRSRQFLRIEEQPSMDRSMSNYGTGRLDRNEGNYSRSHRNTSVAPWPYGYQ